MVLRNRWENEDRAGLVSIGNHKLHVSTSGPARKHGDAVVVFFSGAGAPAILYQRLQRLLSETRRVYFYDRTGYDRSERGDAATLTAQDTARELASLLQQIAVGPPYILVGHSYGCILARAFLAHQQDTAAVTGMVLVEAATELMFQALSPIPDPALVVVAAGVDFVKLTNLRNESRLTEDQWDECIQAVKRTESAAEAEDNEGSALALARVRQFERQVLHSWPIAVISCSMARNFRVLYDAGVEKDQGTIAERARARNFIERVDLFEEEMKASQMRLSSRSKYVHLRDRLHDDILRDPVVVVDAVNWVFEQQSPQTDDL